MHYDVLHGLPDDRYADYDDLADGFNRGLLCEEDLFDPYYNESESSVGPRATTKWDNVFSKHIDTINSDDTFKSTEEWDALSDVLQAGLEAQERLKEAGTHLSDAERTGLELLANMGHMAHEEMFESRLRLATWFTRESMAFHKQQNQRNGKKSVKAKYRNGYLYDYANLPIDYADRFQSVALGLYKAIQKYDPGKGSFTPLAMYYMERDLLNCAKDCSDEYITRLPRHLYDKLHAIQREVLLAESEHRIPNAHDLSYVTNTALESKSPKRVKTSLELLMGRMTGLKTISLEHINEVVLSNAVDGDFDDEKLGVGDLVRAESDYVDLDATLRSAMITSALDLDKSDLTDREIRILELRYGLAGLDTMTLSEVGKIFGLSLERIRQIEAIALGKLRKPTSVFARNLRDVNQATDGDTHGQIVEGILRIDDSALEVLDLCPIIAIDYSTETRRFRSDEKKKIFKYQEDWTD